MLERWFDGEEGLKCSSQFHVVSNMKRCMYQVYDVREDVETSVLSILLPGGTCGSYHLAVLQAGVVISYQRLRERGERRELLVP